jgi:hypothetical protein
MRVKKASALNGKTPDNIAPGIICNLHRFSLFSGKEIFSILFSITSLLCCTNDNLIKVFIANF